MRRITALLVLTLLALGLSGVAPAGAAPTVYHLAPSGDDAGPGTAAAPFRTFTRALPALSPGDTLVVHGGTYQERVRNPSIRPGLPGASIRVVAAPSERPVVQGLLWLSDPDYWTIDGLGVTWSDANGPNEHMVKITGGTGWRITGSTFWGARSYAALLIAGQPSAFRVDHNVIRDTTATNAANQDHLIYFNGGAGGGVIEHNVLANSPNGRGIKIGPSSASTAPIGNLVIRNNTFFNNLGPSNIQLSYGASGNLIERNLLQRPGAGRPAITAYELNGTGNVVRDNVAWEAASVVESDPGLVADGNRLADPRFVDAGAGDLRIANAALAGYGADLGAVPGLFELPAAPAPVVGGGNGPVSSASAGGDAQPVTPRRGYKMMASDGGIFTFGSDFYGSTGDLRLNEPIVGGASTPTDGGYWLVARDGGIFTFGDAAFHGSAGQLRLAQPIVGMAPSPTGQGYWLVGRDGSVYAFGDAPFYGSAAGRATNVIGIVPTASGQGYWIATANGRVFPFGDAGDHGSTGPLNQPVVGIAATPSGRGYWLVARDGGIVTFGDAAFHGSTGDLRLNQPIVGMAATAAGYRLVAADGGVFTFGDASFLGSTGAMRLNSPIISFV